MRTILIATLLATVPPAELWAQEHSLFNTEWGIVAGAIGTLGTFAALRKADRAYNDYHAVCMDQGNPWFSSESWQACDRRPVQAVAWATATVLFAATGVENSRTVAVASTRGGVEGGS